MSNMAAESGMDDGDGGAKDLTRLNRGGAKARNVVVVDDQTDRVGSRKSQGQAHMVACEEF